ncbi:MAG: cysteine desulfurase family protein [Nanoarchaeota archaeon]|nr:cysteine desulfurase family protein [Nanoarchaeota archaeon]
MHKMKIYLDNAATTKVDDKVLKAMLPYFTKEYGNASSLHMQGTEAKTALEKARKIIAKKINTKSSEIYFTSGGTEANNWALKGLFWENYPNKNHIITTKIEHDATLNTCKWLETQGAKITYLNVDKQGFIDLKELENSITPKTILVSIIHGNNEIGTIQDLKKIGEICKKKNILFHTDATQSFTKTELNVKKMNLNLVSINSHKIHGPKGVGALYIKEGIKITPLMHGGGHEKKARSGTENISGIVGFGKAIEIKNTPHSTYLNLQNRGTKDIEKMKILRNKLIKEILEKIPNTKLNGPYPTLNKESSLLEAKRLPNNINISFKNVEGEAVGGYLENQGILVSTGSACMSNTLASSHVLKAIGLSDLEQNSSIRFSLSKYTTEKEINYLMKKLPNIIKKLRRLSPLIK